MRNKIVPCYGLTTRVMWSRVGNRVFSTCFVAVHANVPRFHCCITALPEVGPGGVGGKEEEIVNLFADMQISLVPPVSSGEL